MSKQQYLQELTDFIDSNPDPRELKRALAVMMWIKGVPSLEIQKILALPNLICKKVNNFYKN
jgi:hypothetical protein